ncbi:MAG: hypothetical protein HYY13_08670 [Nitrospirae bacterium]|nr:hypothetical protein [Nitrospirota bacterium]
MNRAHLIHALSFWLLVASGILLLPAPFAEIRQLLVGGHGLQVKRVHLWLSLPFIAGFAGFWGRRGRWVPSRLALLPVWRTGHVWISLVLTAVLAGSGVVLWGKPRWPEPWMEGVRSVHVELTWIACAWGLSHAVVDGVRWLLWRRNAPAALIRRGGVVP